MTRRVRRRGRARLTATHATVPTSICPRQRMVCTARDGKTSAAAASQQTEGKQRQERVGEAEVVRKHVGGAQGVKE
jgi:hypothetical protein